MDFALQFIPNKYRKGKILRRVAIVNAESGKNLVTECHLRAMPMLTESYLTRAV
jgi:hypothetical protein